MATLARRRQRDTNIWPGFVDALATLLMVVMFVLMAFVLAQFFLSEALSGRDQALERLQGRVDELAELLSLERRANTDLNTSLAQLSQELQASLAARDDMETTIRTLTQRAEGAESEIDTLKTSLETALATIGADEKTIDSQVEELGALARDIAALEALKDELEKEIADKATRAEQAEAGLAEEREISETARAQIALLNQQLAALRLQIEGLTSALGEAEKRAEESDAQIASLGKRLNAALAGRVQELSRYRSEFFGRLKAALGDHPGIRVVGDRFVFQSEVLFPTGSAKLEPGGEAQLIQVAETLKDIASRIPADLQWILRIDGHTDAVPIQTPQYPSNWELSTARAMSVVRLLISQGIPPERLAATGFGEFHPIDDGDDEIARRRNRRIELKLTQR